MITMFLIFPHHQKTVNQYKSLWAETIKELQTDFTLSTSELCRMKGREFAKTNNLDVGYKYDKNGEICITVFATKGVLKGKSVLSIIRADVKNLKFGERYGGNISLAKTTFTTEQAI